MNVGRLKNKVRNQAATITQLQLNKEMYKGESNDLKVRCEEAEEMLRQAEANLEAKDKDIKKYQETIEALQKCKQEAEQQTNTYLQGLVKSREEKRELEYSIDYWKEAYKNVCLELEEAKKPWYKKFLKC